MIQLYIYLYLFLSQSSSHLADYRILNRIGDDHAAAAAAAKSLQLWPTLCNPIDGSPPGLPVPGILQEEHWSGVPLPSPTFLAVCLLMGFAVCPCRALNWPVSPVRDRSFPSLIYSAQKMCTAFSFSYQLA